MRIVCVSDLHGSLPETPPCDLLLIAGDYNLSKKQLSDYLAAREATQIVGIAGNHDWAMQKDNRAFRKMPWTYLEDEGTTYGGVKIWGSPWSVKFFDWAFMREDDELEPYWAMIPDDTQILLTHGPAYGIGDKTFDGRHVGSSTLLERMKQLPRLRLHVFGHIHEARGVYVRAQRLHVNAAQMGFFLNDCYPLAFDWNEGVPKEVAA